MGGGSTYQASRWSVGLFGKGGVYLNDALGHTQLTFTDEELDDSDLRLRENQLSFVGEFKLQGRFHITPNVSLRAAYELMYLTSMAHGPAAGHVHSRILLSQYDGRSVLSRGFVRFRRLLVIRGFARRLAPRARVLSCVRHPRGCHCGVSGQAATIGLRRHLATRVGRFARGTCNRPCLSGAGECRNAISCSCCWRPPRRTSAMCRAQNPYGRYVANGLASINDHSLDPVPNRELFDAAMEGMVHVLRQHGDEHSQFLGEAKAGQLRSEIHQQIGDIGVRVGLEGESTAIDDRGPRRIRHARG